MIITGKKVVNPIIDTLVSKLNEKDFATFLDLLHTDVLSHRVKFPILEYVTRKCFSVIPEKRQIDICDKIDKIPEMGSSVITGVALQMRLEKHFDESIAKSIEYIKNGDEWYVCDHIGERVLGVGLLTQSERTLPLLPKLLNDGNKWVVRMVGVAGHYAVKKGLKKTFVEKLFGLLLEHSDETEFHSKRGIGWAAKTTAKFHPDIIAKFQKKIDGGSEVKQWFKTKVKIGLSRSDKYASRYTD